MNHNNGYSYVFSLFFLLLIGLGINALAMADGPVLERSPPHKNIKKLKEVSKKNHVNQPRSNASPNGTMKKLKEIRSPSIPLDASSPNKAILEPEGVDSEENPGSSPFVTSPPETTTKRLEDVDIKSRGSEYDGAFGQFDASDGEIAPDDESKNPTHNCQNIGEEWLNQLWDGGGYCFSGDHTAPNSTEFRSTFP